MFQIPPAPQGIPIAFQDHYYGRDGESLQGLAIEKIERIRYQVKLKDWSAGIIENASLEDLDPAAIAKARSYTQKPMRKNGRNRLMGRHHIPEQGKNYDSW